MSGAQMYDRPSPTDYDGVMHARLTRRMTQAPLPPTVRLLMAEIFRAIPVGRWRHISNATFAHRLRISESTVSRGMEMLVAGDYIQRRPRTDGPGYEVFPLPPPELRPKLLRRQPERLANDAPAEIPPGASFCPCSSDPVHAIPLEGVETRQNEDDVRSSGDPAIFYDHTCSSSMHGAHAPYSEPDSPPQPISPPQPPAGNSLPSVPPDALASYFLSHQWRQLCKVAPAHYGISDLAADVLKLKTRPDLKWPWKVLAAALERGEPIYTQAEIDARDAELRALASAAPPATPRPAGDQGRRGRSYPAAIDTGAYRGNPLYRLGGDTDGLEDADGEEESEEELLALADAARAAPDEAPEPLDEAPEPLDEAPEPLDEAGLLDEPDDVPPPAAPAPRTAPPIASTAPPGDDPLALAVAAVEGAPPSRLEIYKLRAQLKAGDSPAQAADAVRADRESAAWREQRKAILRGGT
jgi:hypothetical protein